MPGNPPPALTTPSELDAGELTEHERQRLRKILLDQDRTTWALRQLKIFVPMFTAFIVAGWQVWAWVADHIKFK